MYNLRVINWLRDRLSRRIGLVVVAFFAFLLPCVLFSFLQYSSLRDLERKTRIEVQDNLRRTLQDISSRTKSNLAAVAVEAMGGLHAADIEQQAPEDIEHRLIEVRKSHSEIDLAFVVVQCSCQKRQFAGFDSEKGAHYVSGEHFKTNDDARAILELFNNALLLRGGNSALHEAVFEQSSCGLFQDNSDGTRSFVFLPLLASDGQSEIGFSGISLKPSFVTQQLLPRTVGEVLSESSADRADARPVISILDESGHDIYVSRPGLRSSEISVPFSPALRQWKLAIGYADTTVAGLARAQFHRNLFLTILGLGLLLIGLLLVLRTAGRELKLAQAKGTFVSNVSHELKTPLALIRLFGETLEMGRVSNLEEARDYGRIINRESGRLTSLINNILDFSRIEAGRREYQFNPADIGQIVEEVMQSYEYQLRGFAVTREIASPLPQIPVDREAISQAILNLINNAMKYSASIKRIDVSVQQRGEDLAVEIADCGIGIAREEQRRVFDKFYRVTNGLVHETRGTGLGLAIVKHIVEAHRGKILIDSTPGKGSRFTILLPIDDSKLGETDPQTSEVTKQGGYRIAENPHH